MSIEKEITAALRLALHTVEALISQIYDLLQFTPSTNL